MRPWLALAALLFALPVACGDDDDGGERVCAAGQQVECACPGGTKGAQACKDDGSGYEACACGAAGGGGAGGDINGGGGTGGSGGGAPNPDDYKGCVRYPGGDPECGKKSKATPIGYLSCDSSPPGCSSEANSFCCPAP